MIRVLVVDDSPTVRQLMIYVLDRQKDMQVVGIADTGESAVRQARKLRPDVITMDIEMPIMDGLAATREIMCTQAIPVIIVSQHMDSSDKKQCFEALDAGAVAVVSKPAAPGHPDHDESIYQLLRNIRVMSEVRVITRRRKKSALKTPVSPISLNQGSANCYDRVVIGASTGGPVALCDFLKQLDQPFPAPIFVVQHIAPGFLPGFIDWLEKATSHTVRIAEQGALPEDGIVYFAPDDQHMLLTDGRIQLLSTPKEHSLRPAVSCLFRSVVGRESTKTAAVLLTGMGADGAVELKELRDAGALTIAQDEESCVVFGMPGEAIKLGAAVHILPPVQIAEILNQTDFKKS